MASGGSYTLKDGKPVLTERSGHNIKPVTPIETKKVNTDENTQKSAADRA